MANPSISPVRSGSPRNIPPHRPGSPGLINKPETFVTPGNPDDTSLSTRLSEIKTILQNKIKTLNEENQELRDKNQELKDRVTKLEEQSKELDRRLISVKEDAKATHNLNNMLRFCFQPASSVPSISPIITNFLFQIAELEREIYLDEEELESFVKRFNSLNTEVANSDLINQLVDLNLNSSKANNTNKRDAFAREMDFLLKRIRDIGKCLHTRTITLDPKVVPVQSPIDRRNLKTSYRTIPLYPNLGETIEEAEVKVSKDWLKVPATWKFDMVSVPEGFRKKGHSEDTES